MSVTVAKRTGTDPRRTSQHRVWSRLIDMLGSRGWILLALFLVLLVAASIVPDVFAPHDHETQNLRARLLGPGESSPDGLHLLGTDSLGRDLFSRMVVGTRLTMFIAVTATLIGAAIGVLFGLLGGYFGGRTDRLLMRLGEAQTAMPMFLVAILLLSLLGPSVGILLVVLPCLVWPIFARVVRAEALRLREETFIEASIATGCSTSTILGRHLLPNVAPRILVLCVVEIGHVMLSEAGLSFLGVGVQPPDTTWGLLISEGRPLLAVAWWLTILPGVLLGITVLVLNLLGRYWEARSGRPDEAPVCRSVGGPMSGMPLLEVEDLHVTFRTASGPVHAVDGVSFTMKPGSSLGVVGESGSGKSVTARALLRLFAITDDVQISGAVHFDGQDLLRIDERRLRDVRGGQIGMIFQDPLTSLNPLMAVGEQIAESLRLHRGMSRSEAAAEAVELLARVGIADPEQRATELPSSFSGGMRQRVMISLAIACRPRLLIADEPTTALDVTVQAEILLLLDELRRSEGMALMLITHDFGVVAATCDDVQVMYAGKLVEKASMAHLFDRANHPYTEGLLRLVPRFEDAHTGRLHPIPGQPPITGGGGSSCAFAPRCGYAVDRCRSEVPPEVAVGPQHLSACWLAADRAKDTTAAGQPWRRAQ